MIIISMFHIKRLILLAFFSQLVACGQKGALILADKEIPVKNNPPPKQQLVEPKKQGGQP